MANEFGKIDRIEAGTLFGRRPRAAGNNARLGGHGIEVEVPLLRLSTDQGVSGFGISQASVEVARRYLGQPLSSLLDAQARPLPAAAAIDFPLWDLLGKLRGKPVYALVAASAADIKTPLRVPCYDTSLYMNDLGLDSDEAGAALIASYARADYEENHRNFKIKVGRGARHLPLEAGIRRDIAVIKAVRAAVGANASIMIDANNGYLLNIAKRVLAETADCQLFWLEEAFHEDPELYAELGRWLAAEGLNVYIADGEGWAAADLMRWAQAGLVQVLQYDIFSHSFSKWLRTGAQLDAWGARTAPHHYGRHLGNFVSGHLATAIAGFTFVEYDETSTPGLDSSAYRVEEGSVVIPEAPGFGLGLEEAAFQAAVKAGGYALTL